MTERIDVLVIGAGANGLSCATALARAGRRVVCIEATDAPGGMAGGFDCADGFRVPGLAQWCYPSDHTPIGEPMNTIVLDPDGEPVTIGADSVQGVSTEDETAWADFMARYLAFTAALQPLLDGPPPRLKDFPAADRKTLFRLAWKLRAGLGRDEMYEFLRVVGMNIYDLLNEHFDNERLKAAIAIDAVSGNAMGPRTPGTVLTWLHRLRGRLNGPMQSPVNYLPSLLAAAQAAGVEIRCGVAVKRLLIDNETVSGAELANGEQLHARQVVSGIDAKTTLLELTDTRHLDAMFATRLSQVRDPGVVAHYSLALAEMPRIRGVDSRSTGHRFLITPDLRGVERAFNAVKYGEASAAPIVEFSLPSVQDASLSPTGHLLSANVLFVPAGLSSDDKSALEQRIRDQLQSVIPDLNSKVRASCLLTPDDIQARCGHSHWHHGELSLHQSLMMRPVYGAAQYATPIDGLFLCSAGCHPGGDLGGRAGANAAKVVLAEGRS
ncbi:MAG: NAD(P)/FAD-dependent oxidoreductase [Pseudomonadota bacterium]